MPALTPCTTFASASLHITACATTSAATMLPVLRSPIPHPIPVWAVCIWASCTRTSPLSVSTDSKRTVFVYSPAPCLPLILHPCAARNECSHFARSQNDVLLLITFSGKTPELLNLLPHLPAELPLIALTSHTSYHTLPLVGERGNTILLPTPIPESEVASFGIAAPTTSTTVTMALGDALALASADRLHSCTGAGEPVGPREVFRRNHPGGAIGIANSLLMDKGGVERIRALAVCWADIPIADEQGLSIGSAGTAGQPPPSPVISETSSESEIDLVDWDCSSGGGADLRAVSGNPGSDDRKRSSNRGGAAHYPSGSLRVLDCLLTAVKSAKGWLRTRDGGLIPPRKLMAASHHLYAEVNAPELGLVADVNDLIKVPAESSVNEAARVLYSRRSLGELTDDTVVVITENGKAFGVVEVGDVIRRGGL